MAHGFVWIPYCTKVSNLKGDIMVHHTLQIKGRSRIMGMWEAGQTQTVWDKSVQVSRLIAKCRQANDVSDGPRSGRPRLCSAAYD